MGCEFTARIIRRLGIITGKGDIARTVQQTGQARKPTFCHLQGTSQ